MKNIGDLIYWVESSVSYGKSIPCPMCCGKLFVTVILGDGSHSKIECGMCSHGCESPSGIAKTWGPEAVVRSGFIDGISTCGGLTYKVGHHSISAGQAFDNQDSAMGQRDAEYKAVEEKARRYYEDNFVTMKKKQVWSVGYHQSSIRELERKIEWHAMRLCMIKEKENGKTKRSSNKR